MLVRKKNGTTEKFDDNKIKIAVSKSAERALVELSDTDYVNICDKVRCKLMQLGYDVNSVVPVSIMHNVVELTLTELNPIVANSYREFRNYKIGFVGLMDKIYKKANAIRYIGEDLSNANTDSTMVSTQRSLIYGYLNKELYQTFFLTSEERQAIEDGFIYIHDAKDRLDGINCCLFDMGRVLKDGFEMGNVWYNEPKTIDTAFDVISDVALSAASQQYGGFTIPQVDDLLEPYAKKSYDKYVSDYLDVAVSIDDSIGDNELLQNADKYAFTHLRRDIEQGFQGWEYKFNTVGSSRGDYPFIAISFGINTSRFGQLISECALTVREGGQGKPGFKKPVLFPKLTFLYDETLHGEGGELESLFDVAVKCSSKSMYPDFLSLTGEGYIPGVYKRYGKVISLMGCRASLSPWYEKGGMQPIDDNDEPVFIGRFNMGAISINLPMILAKSREENKDFYCVLDYYLEMIRKIHKRTFAYLSKKKASTNPLGFMQGGFLGGNLGPNDSIEPLLSAMTMSFGITALNELQKLYDGNSLVNGGEFSLEVMKHINETVNRYKIEDNILYAIYGTPAESLCGLQVEQFRNKYGIVEGVSDRQYVSNSFHCHVSENISPVQKQNLEERFWDYFNGGKIQYCRYPVNYNLDAIKVLVRRAMKKGFYEGVNLSLSYCEDCGYEQLEMDICPKCGSKLITKIDRMNGYLGYTRVHGKTRYNKSKNAEIADRVSM